MRSKSKTKLNLAQAVEKAHVDRRFKHRKRSIAERRTSSAISPQIQELQAQPIIFEPQLSYFFNQFAMATPINFPRPELYGYMQQEPVTAPFRYVAAQPVVNVKRLPQIPPEPRAIDQLLQFSPKKPTSTEQRRPVRQPSPVREVPADRIRYQRNGYTVFDRVLGKGSFSTVYLGQQDQTNTRVAIKQIEDSIEAEIDVMKTVSSDYIIKMLDHWTVRKKLTIVLELCDGSLKDKRMGYTQAIQTFKQIVEGVKCLHEKNIIHRDIKLENILMKGDVVKISDFGLAKKMGSKEWVQSIKCGTPCTMAPEVFFNSNCYNHKPTYNSKCDIWSLGVVLHELVYKCHPFNYDMERFRNCRRVNVKKPVHQVEKILDRCFVIDVDNRANIEQLFQILDKTDGKSSTDLFENKRPKLDQEKTQERAFRKQKNKIGEGKVVLHNPIPKQEDKTALKIAKKANKIPNPKNELNLIPQEKKILPQQGKQKAKPIEIAPKPREPPPKVKPKWEHKDLKELYLVLVMLGIFLLSLLE